MVSVSFATPATDPLVCGSLSCLRHFRDCRRFRKKNRIAKHRFCKPMFRIPEPNAGQDKAGRSNFPHLAIRAAGGENAKNADFLFLFSRRS